MHLDATCALPAGHPWDGAAWERCEACYAALDAAAMDEGDGGGGSGGGGGGSGGGGDGDSGGGGFGAVRGAVALYAPADRSHVSPCFHTYAAVALLAQVNK